MSILLLSVCDHPYHDRFLFGVIASVISACDFLLFMGCFGIPFFVIIDMFQDFMVFFRKRTSKEK